VGDVTVVASPARRSLGVELAEEAERPLTWPGLGRRPPPPFTLVLADDSVALARMSRGRAPGWGAGVAFPRARTIVMRADVPDLPQTLHHELGHLMLGTSVPGPLPLWFDEGYASYASGELGRMEELELNLAVASGRIPNLDELNGMLRGSATAADLAYALAASAVAELDRRPPPGGLGPLVVRLERGEPFDQALASATGLTVAQFEDVWQRSLRHRYSLLTWLAAGGMWTVVGASLGLLWWAQRRRDRPRRAALDEGWAVGDSGLEPDAGPAAPAEPVDRGAPMQ